MVKTKRMICVPYSSVNDQFLSEMRNSGRIYFKDQFVGNKRELCFNNRAFDKDEINPYSSNLGIIGMRKIGIRVIGIGKLK